VQESNGNDTIRFEYDDDSKKLIKEAFWDKIAGYIGICLMIYGTLIWGYGDLIAKVQVVLL